MGDIWQASGSSFEKSNSLSVSLTITHSHEVGRDNYEKRRKKCIERIDRGGAYLGSKEERSTKTKAKCVAKMKCFSRGVLFLKYS